MVVKHRRKQPKTLPWFRGEAAVAGVEGPVVRCKPAKTREAFAAWFGEWVAAVYPGAEVACRVGTIARPPVHGRYARVWWDDAARKWHRRLTEEGKRVVEDYLAAYPKPALVLWKSFPKYAKMALTRRHEDDAHQAARDGVMAGVMTYNPDKGASLKTHIVVNIAGRVQKLVDPKKRRKDIRTVSADGLVDHKGERFGWEVASEQAASRQAQRWAESDWAVVLSSLPGTYRTVFEMSVRHGWENADIAKRVGVSRERVRQMLERAVESLRRRIVREQVTKRRGFAEGVFGG